MHRQCRAEIGTVFPFKSQAECRKLACVTVCFPARQMRGKRKLDALTEDVWLFMVSFTSYFMLCAYLEIDGPSSGFGYLENPVLLS